MENSQKIIIEGITPDGHSFRPADWAERMCGSLSTFRDRRMAYSPLLKPMTLNGIKCVIVDSTLEQEHPAVYAYALEFAKENQLKIRPE